MSMSFYDEFMSALKSKLKEFGYSIASLGKSKKDENANQAEATPENPRVSEATTSDSLINTLIEMDNSYRAEKTGVDLSVPTLPSTLGLSEKEYVPLTYEELKAEAERELLPDYIEDKNSATEKLESTLNKLESKEESTRYAENVEEAELASSYEKSLENHRDDMIFQGIVNSTINDGGVGELASSYASESALVDEKYDMKYAEILASIGEAEREFQNAMESYDLNYSADLQEKLRKLREKEEKRLEEINKYNLDVRKKELEYQKKRAEELKKLRADRQSALFEEMAREQEEEEINGVSAEKRTEYARRSEMARTFYSNFSKEQAERMMSEVGEELYSLLGREEYFKLIYWNVAR